MKLLDQFGRDIEATTPRLTPRGDGWGNRITGFGTSRDKTEATHFDQDPILLWSQLSAIYYGDDLAARMVNAHREEAFREGYALGGDDVSMAQDFDEWARATHLVNADESSKVEHAETWGPLFGGALLIVGTDDEEELDKPLRPEAVTEVLYVIQVDRRNAYPERYYTALGPKIGQPETYRINIQTPRSSTSAVVHETRCVRVGSILTDTIKSKQYAGWDQPLLQRPLRVLREFATMSQALTLMVTDASQGVFKMKGLWTKLAANGVEDFEERMMLVDMCRSIARSVVVDADGESFEKVATSFAGLPELHDRYQQRLSAACGIPVSVLFGRSSAGMNSTGDLDLESWAATVRSYQKKTLGPRLLKLYRLLALDRSSPSKGKPIDGLTINWLPLRIPTDLDAANAYTARANGDAIYIDRGVVAPQEIAIARFGRGEYSGDAPKVDVNRLTKELEDPVTFEAPPKLTGSGSAAPATDADKSGTPADPSGEAAKEIDEKAQPKATKKQLVDATPVDKGDDGGDADDEGTDAT